MRREQALEMTSGSLRKTRSQLEGRGRSLRIQGDLLMRDFEFQSHWEMILEGQGWRMSSKNVVEPYRS